MTNQLIDVMLPLGRAGGLTELLREIPLAGSWSDSLEGHVVRIHLPVETGYVEAVL